GLGAAKILLQDLVEPAVDREHARGLDLQRVRPYEGSKLRVVVAGSREVVLDGDVDGDGVTALRDELCRVARRSVVRGDDRRDARVFAEGRQRGVDGRMELGTRAGEGVAREDQREGAAARARQL